MSPFIRHAYFASKLVLGLPYKGEKETVYKRNVWGYMLILHAE